MPFMALKRIIILLYCLTSRSLFHQSITANDLFFLCVSLWPLCLRVFPKILILSLVRPLVIPPSIHSSTNPLLHSFLLLPFTFYLFTSPPPSLSSLDELNNNIHTLPLSQIYGNTSRLYPVL